MGLAELLWASRTPRHPLLLLPTSAQIHLDSFPADVDWGHGTILFNRGGVLVPTEKKTWNQSIFSPSVTADW